MWRCLSWLSLLSRICTILQTFPVLVFMYMGYVYVLLPKKKKTFSQDVTMKLFCPWCIWKSAGTETSWLVQFSCHFILFRCVRHLVPVTGRAHDNGRHWIILWVIRETRVFSVIFFFLLWCLCAKFLKPHEQQLTDWYDFLIPKSKWCWWSSFYFENNDPLQCAIVSICSIWVDWSHSTCVHYFSPGLLSITWHPLPLPLCIHA